jgi:stringent starvation protein A
MAVVRKPHMTLYADSNDILSHCVRFALAEKQVGGDVVYIDANNPPEDFLEINPHGNLPTLVDRTLILNSADIILNYLDERFPHPPLFPIYPIAKAKSRLMVYRIQEDWFSIYKHIDNGADKKITQKMIQSMFNDLQKIASSFEEWPYFLSPEFSIVDCYAAPFFWRFKHYGIDLSSQPQAIQDYCERVFKRNSFQAGLSEDEYELSDIYDDVV